MTDNPRVAWLSPYGPRSDIGAFTRCLVPHFSKADGAPAFDCDLFVNAFGPSYDAPVPTMDIPAGGAIGEVLSRYDAAVFNLGNNVENHENVVEALRRAPGIAILHDFSYHHFFAHKCFEKLRSAPAYARLIHDYYGSAGFNMALRSGVITRDATLYAPWDGENVADYPLMQPLVTLAAAVVVHSRFMEEHIVKFFKGPILRLFLPSDQKITLSPNDLTRWRRETANKERCQFTSFGHIGRAKSLDTIIHAIAQSPALRARAHLVIAGHPGDREFVLEIETMVAKFGLGKQVTLEYDITDERLLAIKNETDIFLNLRYPNTEGASGSLTEMMNAGKPVIAYRAGSYTDVPEGAAVLIDRAAGLNAVVDAMEGLMSAPDRRIAIGAAALKHVRGENSEKYIGMLKAFILDSRDTLRRRGRLTAPVRDGFSWQSHDVAPDDASWFSELTRARRSLLLLERDSSALSPEIFLTWPMDDLVAITVQVLLQASSQARLSSVVADCVERLGRWPFYLLVCKLRFYQALCENAEISKDDTAAYAERIKDIPFWNLAIRLRPEIVIRMLYFCVLGRGWEPGETEYWSKRIRQGLSVTLALLEFLTSPEYRQTFPDQVMGDVEEWARAESSLSTATRGQTRPQTAWPLGEPIRFSEDNSAYQALLGTQWHRREALGRWSNGRTADLRFLMPDLADHHSASLTLRLRVVGTKVTGPRQIVALCNNVELATIVVENDIPRNWTIALPKRAHLKEGVNLILMADRDFSPAMGGESSDKRLLGILLMEGRLTVDAPESQPAG